LAIVTNVGRDAVDAYVAQDERSDERTAKSRGLGAPTLALNRRNLSPMTETTKPGLRREREVNR